MKHKFDCSKGYLARIYFLRQENNDDEEEFYDSEEEEEEINEENEEGKKNKFIVVISMPHICCDGTSLYRLLNDLIENCALVHVAENNKPSDNIENDVKKLPPVVRKKS